MSFEVPIEVLNLLKLREGWKTEVYLDTLDKPTVGMGHLLAEEESEAYPIGSTVPDDILERWASNDAQGAYNAAMNQARNLRVGNQNFVNALACVNFQLGRSWYAKFPKTWALMNTGQWTRAAEEIKSSLWYKETPVRVTDFISTFPI